MNTVISDERDSRHLARVLFPGLASELDAALARHGSADRSDRDFDAELDRAASERFAGAGLGALAGSPGGSRLARAFERAGAVVSWAGEAVPGLTLPEPEAFEAAGYDLAGLSELLARDERLAPVPAPYGLGARGWAALFERAAQRPGSPFAVSEPLILASEVSHEFAILDEPPGAVVPNSTAAGDRVRWSLRLVPSDPAPAVLGLNFAHGGPHATLPEMLMLQLMRAAVGAPLLDGGDRGASFTWLAGPLAGGRLAARHVWDSGERAIRITAREIGSQGPHLGARPPVTA